MAATIGALNKAIERQRRMLNTGLDARLYNRSAQAISSTAQSVQRASQAAFNRGQLTPAGQSEFALGAQQQAAGQIQEVAQQAQQQQIEARGKALAEIERLDLQKAAIQEQEKQRKAGTTQSIIQSAASIGGIALSGATGGLSMAIAPTIGLATGSFASGQAPTTEQIYQTAQDTAIGIAQYTKLAGEKRRMETISPLLQGLPNMPLDQQRLVRDTLIQYNAGYITEEQLNQFIAGFGQEAL